MLIQDRAGLGGRIRAARERLGRNRNQMARELGTSWQHVDRWERGATEPSPESLRKLAGYLGVSVDHLLGSEGEVAAPSAAVGDAFDDFLSSYAPHDITDAEVSWLRAAPVDHAHAAPGDYVNMLHGLRTTTARPASTPPPALEPRPKSGRQRKVDVSTILTRDDAGADEETGEGRA